MGQLPAGGLGTWLRQWVVLAASKGCRTRLHAFLTPTGQLHASSALCERLVPLPHALPHPPLRWPPPSCRRRLQVHWSGAASQPRGWRPCRRPATWRIG